MVSGFAKRQKNANASQIKPQNPTHTHTHTHTQCSGKRQHSSVLCVCFCPNEITAHARIRWGCCSGFQGTSSRSIRCCGCDPFSRFSRQITEVFAWANTLNRPLKHDTKIHRILNGLIPVPPPIPVLYTLHWRLWSDRLLHRLAALLMGKTLDRVCLDPRWPVASRWHD